MSQAAGLLRKGNVLEPQVKDEHQEEGGWLRCLFGDPVEKKTEFSCQGLIFLVIKTPMGDENTCRVLFLFQQISCLFVVIILS